MVWFLVKRHLAGADWMVHCQGHLNRMVLRQGYLNRSRMVHFPGQLKTIMVHEVKEIAYPGFLQKIVLIGWYTYAWIVQYNVPV